MNSKFNIPRLLCSSICCNLYFTVQTSCNIYFWAAFLHKFSILLSLFFSVLHDYDTSFLHGDQSVCLAALSQIRYIHFAAYPSQRVTDQDQRYVAFWSKFQTFLWVHNKELSRDPGQEFVMAHNQNIGCKVISVFDWIKLFCAEEGSFLLGETLWTYVYIWDNRYMIFEDGKVVSRSTAKPVHMDVVPPNQTLSAVFIPSNVLLAKPESTVTASDSECTSNIKDAQR